MDELKTFLGPGTELFFFAIVWLVGFIRQRNIGFLLPAFVTLAQAALHVTRQALINVVIFHSSSVSAAKQDQASGLPGTPLWLFTFLLSPFFFEFSPFSGEKTFPVEPQSSLAFLFLLGGSSLKPVL
jgi:hypothetical protein